MQADRELKAVDHCGEHKPRDYPTSKKKQYGYDFGDEGVSRLKTVAAWLDCSVRTVHRLVKDGYLRKGYINRRPVICRRSVRELLKSCEKKRK